MTSPSFEHLSIDEIELDIDNPRIKRFLESYEGDRPTPDQIYQALGAGGDDADAGGPTFEKLKQSILTNGTIIHPIIVNKRSDAKLVCIEGNTRLALYRSFRNEEYAGNWQSIPSLVYKSMSEEDIDAIRLQIHLVGTRQWDPYSKAKYLHRLRTQAQMPFSSIVDYAGGREREVQELINAYSDMEQYYRPLVPDDGAFDITRFSGFLELQRSGIKQAIAQAGFELSDFAEWIDDQRLYPLHLVRKLPAILQKPEAREAFLSDGAKVAERLLDRPDLSKTLEEADIAQLAQALTQAIYNTGWQERDRIATRANTATADSLAELSTVIQKFLEAAGQ
jgi:hypothetical protein